MAETYRPRPHLREERLGDEIMVFDEETDQVHVLNEASAAIWDALKGGLDVPGIERSLRERYDLGAHPDPAAMIRESLRSMAGKGLLGPALPAGEKQS